MNPFVNSCDNKRYYTYNYYLKKRFGTKVYRAAVDIGAGCPNRDGKISFGGCIFCADGEKRCGKFQGIDDDELDMRILAAKQKVSGKVQNGPYIIYFQSGSNTYGDTELFERAFERALKTENTVGLCVATRADCIDEQTADMLENFSEKTYLTVELGLQTVHDKTARLCGRGHDLERFLAAYEMLISRNINIGVHIINGLPFETKEMMLQTVQELAKLKLHCLKIHMLYIEKGTGIEKMYSQGAFQLLTREEYVDIVCSQLELLSKDVIIARLTGDGESERLIAPEWSRKKLCVMNEIDKELVRRQSFQGKFFDV